MTHYEIQHPLGFHTIYKLGNEPINRAIVALIIKSYEQNLCVCKKIEQIVKYGSSSGSHTITKWMRAQTQCNNNNTHCKP